MSELKFRKITADEGKPLAEFLSGDTWPFLFHARPTWEAVIAWISEGRFFGPGEEAYWVLRGDELVGLIELTRLNEQTPHFTMRLRTPFRRRGLGRPMLEWLTAYVFETFPHKQRIEARTREDNVAMRKLFNKCGYVKEAYYRQTTPVEDGGRLSSVGYGILRDDWASKKVTRIEWVTDPMLDI